MEGNTMNLIAKADMKIGRYITKKQDIKIDTRVCGQSLAEYVPSINRDDAKGTGGTGSDSTHYSALKKIFSDVTLTSSDALIDVGCGKGRVIAFFLSENCPAQLYGIEYNEDVGKLAQEWTESYDQAHIMIGDALTLDYNPYTFLTLARSFLPKTFMEFIKHLEENLTHPITFISWYEQSTGRVLDNRPGWTKLQSGEIFRINGLRLYPMPQAYSIRIYDPSNRE